MPAIIKDRRRRFATFRAIFALMLRELQTTYGRSVGGYIWVIAEPVIGTALLAFLFSLALRSPPLGNNFALFYATALLPLTMYLDIVGKVATSVTYSKKLLFYPAVTFMDALLARFFLAVLTQCLVFIIVTTAVLLFFDLPVQVDFILVLKGLFLASLIGFSFGVMNCLISAYLPVWLRIWAIANRPMFILSCILFLFEAVPEPYQSWLWYNPMVHAVALVRAGFYPQYLAEYASMQFVCGLCLTVLAISLVTLRRFNKDIINL